MRKKSSSLEKLKQLRNDVVAHERKLVSDESPAVAADAKGPSDAPKPAVKRKPPGSTKNRETNVSQLSETARRKLTIHTAHSLWTPESLMEELIHQQLHTAYPRISYRGAVLAELGTFRSYDRSTRRPAMLLRSSAGRFLIRCGEENACYLQWLGVYRRRGDSDVEGKAAEMAVFLLQQALEEYELPGNSQVIPPDFLVEPFGG